VRLAGHALETGQEGKYITSFGMKSWRRCRLEDVRLDERFLLNWIGDCNLKLFGPGYEPMACSFEHRIEELRGCIKYFNIL
jgi:hypothetical protein